MTEKRYKVHNIIKGMDVGELVDLELMKELIEKYGAYENMNVEIMNNGKKMTYKEVVDLLNINEQLKKSIKRQQLSNEECSKYIEEVVKENEQLKEELKICREWINSDKNDYELTLAFIKNKGFSLQDVLNYGKTLK